MSREVVIAGLLLGVVVLVAAGLWMLGRSRGAPGSSADLRPEFGDSNGGHVVWQGPIPSEVADYFTKATTHAERLKWVRHADKVSAEMEAFFRDGPGASEKVARVSLVSTSGQEDFLYENYLVGMEKGEPRLLSISVDPKGAKVDFEAYARSCSEKWEDLVSGAVPSAEEVRVLLQPGGFFMHRFPDEKKWIHFKAVTPDLPDTMDFYVERDSEAARKLSKGIEQFPQATLSVRAVEDSAKYRQFEITAVKALGWVEPEG